MPASLADREAREGHEVRFGHHGGVVRGVFSAGDLRWGIRPAGAQMCWGL